MIKLITQTTVFSAYNDRHPLILSDGHPDWWSRGKIHIMHIMMPV